MSRDHSQEEILRSEFVVIENDISVARIGAVTPVSNLHGISPLVSSKSNHTNMSYVSLSLDQNQKPLTSASSAVSSNTASFLLIQCVPESPTKSVGVASLTVTLS